MKTYFRILSYALPIRKNLPFYVVFTILATVFGAATFALLKPLLDIIFGTLTEEELLQMSVKPNFRWEIEYFQDLFYFYFKSFADQYGKIGSLYFMCGVIIIAVFLANVFRYGAAMILAKIRANVISKLRKDIFRKVTRLHSGYFSEQRKGDIMSRITNDVQEVERSVVDSLTVAFSEPFTMVAYFTILFIMSVKLTIFTLVVLPLSGLIISSISKRLKRTARASQVSLGNLVNILDETLGGMRVIKAFNARNYIINTFDKEVGKYERINIAMARKNNLASPASEFLGVSVVAGIILFGGSLVLGQGGDLEASAFITYILVFSQVLNPIKNISRAFSNVQRGLAAGERIFRVIDTNPDIKDRDNAHELESFEREIEFKHVGFAYNEELVLKEINFRVPRGKTVALVGPSGGGKSTLADLIPRFYDTTEGEICIDGTPLKDLKIDSIRAQMGIVTQESILFNDTVFNNIAFGIKDANEEDVIRAAKIANAHDFIEQMEKGYQTKIGERGSRLSGGQRQRISIARAVFKNPPILILDEATSALDSESEKLVQGALTNLMKNRTSIVIAHRLSTIQHADEILVIQQGRIVESGKHKDLIALDGVYKKLTEMQAF
ncbi:ABC transporter ATP-binding protein [Xanthovirga aplysinae]|uniref:ABC transporter ATP-binding protein n=1 Tax=Xanthovirga aplysinae TaxID=2529853 RepID=UPI0012BCBD4C|nr:ABC transporter ATP-binding protein [Xanthovirga aplysinae]MTI31162.1 ABC transporter ATP-binding protein [Xanthovirga aplysinae]